MNQHKYPYLGWTLQPSFKPVQIELVGASSWDSSRYDETAKQKAYELSNIFQNKAAALAAGRTRLAAQQVTLDLKQAAIWKRRAALDKAETI